MADIYNAWNCGVCGEKGATIAEISTSKASYRVMRCENTECVYRGEWSVRVLDGKAECISYKRVAHEVADFINEIYKDY